MRYSIMGFEQEALLSIQTEQLKLDMSDILLMDYIQRAISQPSMIKHYENGQPYVWLQHSKILEDLPILGIKNDMLKKRLNKLVELHIIKSITLAANKGQGSRSYYTITEVFESLQFSSEDSTRGNKLPMLSRPEVINYPCSNRPEVINYPSDNKLIDNKEIRNKDKEVMGNTHPSGIFNFGKPLITKADASQNNIQTFLELYNAIEGLPTIKKMTDKRNKAILKLFKNFGLEEIKRGMQQVEHSDFLRGKATDFKADIDWICNENNFIKILEGKYSIHFRKKDNNTAQRVEGLSVPSEHAHKKDMQGGNYEKF